ncbi:heavy-metal-associated domain-containing protein [Rhizosaccharibacter radicis]|uniref:Heavy-metal-associated domain-containing protein n=1 Tax=Rhizosaccharibacter radicis TaxID=2782605 RepID=A0ABT1W134_9PROT|nr:heavy-metal-associated domain-containing protein [Acetobacteraceae bacterium KSS12]
MKLSVPDMSCEHCATAVRNAIRSVDPDADASVDLGGKTVSVRTVAAEADILSAVHDAGYEEARIA